MCRLTIGRPKINCFIMQRNSLFYIISAPTGSPTITDLVLVSDTSAVVYWTPPPQPERQGIIAGYILKLSNAGESDSESASITYEHSISADRREYSVYDLEEGKEYVATISAATVAGRGPQSQPTNFSASMMKRLHVPRG